MPLPSNVDPPDACTVILLVASSPLAPLIQNTCPTIGAEVVHCGKVSVFAEDDELFHTIVWSEIDAESAEPLETTRLTPEPTVALITPFEISIVLPSGSTMPNEPVVASPGVTARDQ